jgi:hypothetical protein
VETVRITRTTRDKSSCRLASDMRSHLAAAARGALLASLFLCLLCATLSFSPAPRPALRAASSSGRAFHAPAAAPATPRLAPSRAAARRAWPVACTGAGGAGGAGGGTLESAVLGGGCFWCTEAVHPQRPIPPPPVLSGRAASLSPVLIGHVSSLLPSNLK